MGYSDLIRWYRGKVSGNENWGDFSDEEVAEALDAITNFDGRVKKVNRDRRLIDPLASDLEDDFIASVDSYQGYKNLNSNRDLSSGAKDRLVRKVVDEVSFDADEIRRVNSEDKSLAYKIRRSARSNSSDVLSSLTDDELLEDYLSVQRKKGSDYFLSSQELVEEVNRRGLI